MRRPGEDVTPDVTWLPVDLRGMAGQPKPQTSYDMPGQPSAGVPETPTIIRVHVVPRVSSVCD